MKKTVLIFFSVLSVFFLLSFFALRHSMTLDTVKLAEGNLNLHNSEYTFSVNNLKKQKYSLALQFDSNGSVNFSNLSQNYNNLKYTVFINGVLQERNLYSLYNRDK